jgi:hypothetical protein
MLSMKRGVAFNALTTWEWLLRSFVRVRPGTMSAFKDSGRRSVMWSIRAEKWQGKELGAF